MERRNRVCNYFNSYYGCSKGESCEFRHVLFIEREFMFHRKEWPAEDGDRIENTERICRYYNSDYGCRYFGKDCTRIHIKGSLMLSGRLMWKTKALDFVFEMVRDLKPEDVKKIIIYDFDKTLCQTFDRPSGLREYKRVMKREWPHGDTYYGTPDSMKYPLAPKKGPSFESCERDLKRDDCLVVMMTGRDAGFRNVIHDVLCRFELNIPIYVFKPRGWKLGTKWYKISFMRNKLLSKFFYCEDIEMYEDRLDHARDFDFFLRNTEGLKNFEVRFASDFPYELDVLRKNRHFVDLIVQCTE